MYGKAKKEKKEESSGLTFLPPEFDEKVMEEEMMLKMEEHNKNLALSTTGILNDIGRGNDIPKKILHYDGHLYAFVYSAEKEINYCLIESKKRGNRRNGYTQGYALWVKEEGTGRAGQWAEWDEVSDLTDVSVYVYQRLKEIAIAIGWVRRNNSSDWLI